MQKEILIRKKKIKQKKIETIYFGGGTPSILNGEEIDNFISLIKDNYSVSKDIEITMECNPDDLNKKQLKIFKNAGVNRLSIGVQSFKNKDLVLMNRAHNSKDAINSILMAKEIGFNNISVDLIYGIPNQTIEEWSQNIDLLLKLNIQHISAYSLTVEKNTVLHHLVKKKKVIPTIDEKVLEQFHLLQEKMQNGDFIHYEISNFAKKGFFSKHNTSYWQRKSYIGIGPSAHSFDKNIRSWNVSSNKKYIHSIKNNLDYATYEVIDKNQSYNEYILTSLRTIWGVNTLFIKNTYGIQIYNYFISEISKWKTKKYLKKNKNNISLTKKGKDFADRIASDLFIVE